MIAILLYTIIYNLILSIEYILSFYIILGWGLMIFRIDNPANFFMKIYLFLMARIEPIFGYFRQFLPRFKMLDFSPLVVFFVLDGLRRLVNIVFMLML